MVSVATRRITADRARFGGLVWTLIRTDFKTRYHGTVGGFVWALLKPLTMFLVLLTVFSYVFANEPGYKLDLIIGLFLYDFFQEATKSGLLSLRAKISGNAVSVATTGGCRKVPAVVARA